MKTEKTPLFRGIGEAALAEMFTCGGARCKTYAKGEVLLRAGCITREVGVVQAGGVNIENIDLWGNRSILSHVPAGQVFAETYAFCGEPMMVDVVAAEETGGLAFEGLNNAGASKQTNLLVILNDNNMAIDQATGALKNYLVKISTSRRYNAIKRRLWRILSHTPAVLRFCQKAGNAVKQGLLKNSNLFESLNFRYFGPIDGHN